MSMHPDIIKLTHELFPVIAEFIIQKEKEKERKGFQSRKYINTFIS